MQTIGDTHSYINKDTSRNRAEPRLKSGIISCMPKASTNFVCQQCGYISPSYLGRCPNCDAWNSFVETPLRPYGSRGQTAHKGMSQPALTINLNEIKSEAVKRNSTGIPELDQVLGGGIVPGMALLLAGEPGIGKSTLLLELAKNYPGKVVYVAGEESASQIKIRADRLGVKSTNIAVLEETDTDVIAETISSVNLSDSRTPILYIVDSIQTLASEDLTGTAGSVGQVREGAARLIAASKPKRIPLFIVGHVTKEGSIAGPKVLEHIVDTVLTIEGDRFAGLRLIRTSKNRFGPTDEVGIFEMTDKGLTAVQNPTKLFTEKADASLPGSALTITMEGTRPILAEIQALVTDTPIPSPRRVASGVDHNRLLTIVAILQKRLNIPLYKEDVYVSVAGGLRIDEPGADLAIALAIISSYRNKALPKNTVSIGELDLLGNLRPISGLERRVKEAKKLGFANLLSPQTLKSLSEVKF